MLGKEEASLPDYYYIEIVANFKNFFQYWRQLSLFTAF